MSYTFKSNPSKKLVGNLQQQQPIQAIEEVTGLSLMNILQNFTIEIPEEYIPGHGWTITWLPEKVSLQTDHIDLVQTALKFAWLYSSDSKNELLQSFVGRELTMFEAGVRLEKVRFQKVIAGRSDKHSKALRKWIKRKLSMKKKWTHQALWNALPESYDDEEFYLENNKIILKGKYNSKGKPRSIGFKAFENNIRAVKKTLNK